LQPLLEEIKTKNEGISLISDQITKISFKYPNLELEIPAKNHVKADLNIKVAAFADDVTIFAANNRELELTIGYITKFEKVSGSKLSLEKSKIFSAPSITGQEDMKKKNSIPKITVRKSSPKLVYLGIPIHTEPQESREKIIKDIKFKYFSSKMLLMNVFEKVTGYNTYIIPKLLYRAMHDPLESAVIEDIENSFKKICQNHARLSLETLKTHKEFGGFGMIDLRNHFLHQFGKIIYNVLTDETQNIYYEIFRHKIQCTINGFIQTHRLRLKVEEMQNQNQLGIIATDLNDKFIRTHPWYAVLVGYELSIPLVNGVKSITLLDIITSNFFSKSEKAYLKAWEILFELDHQNPIHPMRNIRDQEFQNILKSPVPMNYRTMRPEMFNCDFRKGSKKEQEKKNSSKISTTLLNFHDATPKHQKKYWKKLNQIAKENPGTMESTYLMNLGLTLSKSTNSPCKYCNFPPENYSETPAQTKIDYINHYYVQCQISKQLWIKTNIGMQLSWKSLIMSIHEKKKMIKIDRFMYYVERFNIVRRTNESWGTKSIPEIIFLILAVV
ncbi:MAG TPA: hypothetical protein VGW31_15570, partial [Hanamia sp.]|nr:hypothetical protein [Hanamia sp.]